jgi:hypothetical protein
MKKITQVDQLTGQVLNKTVTHSAKRQAKARIEAQSTISDEGGFEGSQQTLQLKSKKNRKIRYSYEHYIIPDNFIIRYEGQNLLETGFVGGSRIGELQIPKGKSKSVQVIVATNDENTEWEYTVSADVSAVGCADTTPITIEALNTTFEDKDGECEATGTIAVGRSDGLSRLIRIEGGTARYNQNRLKVSPSTVYAQIGNIRQPLFTGEFNVLFPSGKSSDFKETGQNSNELKLAGLDVKFDSIALQPRQIKLGGAFQLPFDIFGIPIAIKSDAFIINEEGLKLGLAGEITLPELKKYNLFNLLPLNASDLKITRGINQDLLKIQGKLAVNMKKLLPSSPDLLIEADLAEENYIQIENGKADFKGVVSLKNIEIPGGWGLNELKLTLDTEEQVIGGDVSVKFPFGAAIGLGGSVRRLQLERISGSVSFSDPRILDKNPTGIPTIVPTRIPTRIPIGTTGLFLDEIAGAIDKISDIPYGGFPEFQGSIKASSASVLDVLDKPTVSLEASVTIGSKEAVGNGKLTLVDPKISEAKVELKVNWQEKFVQANGEFEFLDGLINAKADVRLDSSLNFNLYLECCVFMML